MTDGYEEFIEECLKHQVFPLLNIELIGISKEDQEAGIRVNDPSNPGRTYISGKGLAFPFILPTGQQRKLDRVVEESNRQVEQMIDLLNRWLEFQESGISLSVEEIMEKHAKTFAAREACGQGPAPEAGRMLEVTMNPSYHFWKRFMGEDPRRRGGRIWPGLEEELRARLLKAGAPAFVPEDDKAFLAPGRDYGDSSGMPEGFPPIPCCWMVPGAESLNLRRKRSNC